MTLMIFATFGMICIAFNIYAQNKPENLESFSLPTQTTPIAIIITSIISTIAIIAGAYGAIHFSRKSTKIEEKEYTLRVTPILELKPVGGTRSGLREFSTKIIITNKGQLHTTITNIKIDCIVPGYTTEITKSFSKVNILAVGDSLEQSAGFTNHDVLTGMLNGRKENDTIIGQDIKLKWTIDCIGADDKRYTFVKSSQL